MNVYDLRRSGATVKVSHVREFIGIHRTDDNDNFMTRGEYEQAKLNGELRYDGVGVSWYFSEVYNVPEKQMPSYGVAVSPVGGWTQVEVIMPSGDTVTGKYSFSNRNFNKSLGTRIALNKALGSYKHTTRQSKKESKVYA